MLESRDSVRRSAMTVKDYSKLNKQFIMIDMYDDPEDCEVQAGVAIPAEHA